MAYPTRGAWVFYNVTRSVSFWPTLDSILITQELPDMTATLSCRVVDPDADMTFAVEDQIRVTFAGERIWAGHLKAVTEDRLEETGPRAWDLEGQDYTAKLDDAIIERRKKRKKERVIRRVRWLLRQLDRRVWTLSGKDLSNLPDQMVEAYDYYGASVDEGLAHVADELSLHYYIDLDNVFQMYRNDAVAAPFGLDNVDPDKTDTFPFREWRMTTDSVDLANAVLVEPEKRKHAVWVKDATSIATYGRQERFLSDSNLNRRAQAEVTGNRTLRTAKDPTEEATLVCWEPGLQAGMWVRVTEALWEHDYDRYVSAVRITAVDPHDDDGEAYLKTEATLQPLWTRKPRRGRDGTNKNARRRPGQHTDVEERVLDDFQRVVTPATIATGDPLGVTLGTRGATKGVNAGGVEQPFTLRTKAQTRVGSYVGDWYLTPASPSYACDWPKADFRGWWDKEAWAYLTVPAHPAGMAGIYITIHAFGADGSGYGGGGRATIDGLEVVAKSSAPTDSWQGSPIGKVTAFDADTVILIPAAHIPLEGGLLWVGVRPNWRCDYGATPPYCDYPLWPYDTGLGNSGRCQASITDPAWATWVAEGGSMGSIKVYPSDAPWDGGNAWRDGGVEGSPEYGVDGSAYYVTSTGLGGRGLYVVGTREDETEPRGPWSDVSWAMSFTFEVDDEGDTGTAGPRHIQVITTGEGEQTVGTVHLGDSTNAAGISVGGPTTTDYKAKAIVAGTKYRAKFDSRSGKMRGKLWAATSKEPAAWDVSVAISETEDDLDRVTLWVRCGNTTEQTVRIYDITAWDDAGDGKRVVRELLGVADGSSNSFTTNHPFRVGTLRVFVNGVAVAPKNEDGDEGSFRLDHRPTDGSVIRATYTVDQGDEAGADPEPDPDPVVPDPTPGVGVGPRYDFYGAGSGGSFPAFPSGATVKVVPASYAASGDGSALSAWIAAQPDGSTIVFDSSGGGSDYGAGTLYTLDDHLWLSARVSGVTQVKSLTLWGYNVKMQWSNKNLVTTNGYGNQWMPGLLTFTHGGWKDCQILGFELQGANTRGGQWDCRTNATFNESEKGIYLGAHQDTLIQDCWVHHLGGDTIYASPYDPHRADQFVFPGAKWWNTNLSIKNCRLEKTGNQNVNIKIVDGLVIDYNVISRTGIHPINFEKGAYDPYPAGYRDHPDHYIRNNLIEYPACHITRSGSNWQSPGISFALHETEDSATNWVVTDNEFGGGAFGYGNPAAEVAVLGAAVSPLPQARHAFSAPPHFFFFNGRHPDVMTGLTFSRNVMRYPLDQLRKGMSISLGFWNSVTVEDNILQNVPIATYQLTSATFSGNDSPIVPYTGLTPYSHNIPYMP